MGRAAENACRGDARNSIQIEFLLNDDDALEAVLKTLPSASRLQVSQRMAALRQRVISALESPHTNANRTHESMQTTNAYRNIVEARQEVVSFLRM